MGRGWNFGEKLEDEKYQNQKSSQKVVNCLYYLILLVLWCNMIRKKNKKPVFMFESGWECVLYEANVFW